VRPGPSPVPWRARDRACDVRARRGARRPVPAARRSWSGETSRRRELRSRTSGGCFPSSACAWGAGAAALRAGAGRGGRAAPPAARAPARAVHSRVIVHVLQVRADQRLRAMPAAVGSAARACVSLSILCGSPADGRGVATTQAGRCITGCGASHVAEHHALLRRASRLAGHHPSQGMSVAQPRKHSFTTSRAFWMSLMRIGFGGKMAVSEVPLQVPNRHRGTPSA